LKLELDNVILVGRTFSEYKDMFLLHNIAKEQSILDAASGVSSFGAEARQNGYHVKSSDKIYMLEHNEINKKCAADLDNAIHKISDIKELYKWGYFKNLQDLKGTREYAYKLFLNDYKINKGKYYIYSEFPDSSFSNNEFDIVLVSHFLFLYDELFTYEFHKKVIKELCRIAKCEIRIYPLINLQGEKSKYVDLLINDSDFPCADFSIEKVNYEFVHGADSMLKIKL
jgi:hypothetical protein